MARRIAAVVVGRSAVGAEPELDARALTVRSGHAPQLSPEAVVIATGLWSFAHLTIDAVPDLTPVQVQILTRAPALGPVDLDVEPGSVVLVVGESGSGKSLTALALMRLLPRAAR